MRKRNFLRLKIRQQTFTEHGISYLAWLVYGYAPDGRRIRKQFQNKGEATAWANSEETRILNADVQRHPIMTRLTAEQVEIAERALSRLGERASLTDAVDCFLKHNRQTDSRKSLKDGITAFLKYKEAAGLRARTIVQLKSVLNLFAAKFGQSRNVDEVTTANCSQFLGSRGTSAKTWNNYRADLHNFFEYASSKAVNWCASNPVTEIEKRRQDGRAMPSVLNADAAKKLMQDAESYESGCLVPFLALALFAGLRSGPGGELHKILGSDQRGMWIDCTGGVIHVQPNVSKTREYRQTKIQPNLTAWLGAYPPGPLPANFDRKMKAFRTRHKLTHDILRHTFFSMHVGAFGSVAEAALQGGNTEAICRRHYLNLTTKDGSAPFWSILPEKTQVQNT